MKKILILCLIIFILMFTVSCGSRPSEYETVSLYKIGEDVSNNLGRATNNYVGNYYEFKAELSYISNDLKSISAYEIDPAKDLGVEISGKLLDKEDQEIIMNANDGDIVVIKGKITDIELGFMISANLKMDVYEIEII